MNFDDSFTRLMGEEGGYVDNPADPGGETMWGITARIARANGYQGAMRDLPQATAKDIARKIFWNPAGCDAVPDAIKFDLFDTAYNSSPRQAIVLLQITVGEVQDGVMGAHTVMATQSMDPLRLVARFNGWRLSYLGSLPTWPTFGRGWAHRIAEILIAA